MTLMIIIFAAMMLLAGIVMLLKPEIIFGFLETNHTNPLVYAAAIAVRLLIGGLLVSQLSVSDFPITVGALGWILILSALFLFGIGHARFTRLMQWVLSRFKPFGRVAGIFAMFFGGFIITAFS